RSKAATGSLTACGRPSEPLARTRFVQVAPPSVLYAANRPGNVSTSVLEATNTWEGFAGLMATVASPRLPGRRLTLTLGLATRVFCGNVCPMPEGPTIATE